MARRKELIMAKGPKTRRKISSWRRAGEVVAETYAIGTTEAIERVLETLSAQELSEPALCCRSSRERNGKYLDGELTLQDIVEILDHLKECELCSRQREIERAIRAAVKRCCAQEQAPKSLKAKIIVQIGMMAE